MSAMMIKELELIEKLRDMNLGLDMEIYHTVQHVEDH